MTKIEWLKLAQEAITKGRGDKAITYINEVIELIKIKDKSDDQTD